MAQAGASSSGCDYAAIQVIEGRKTCGEHGNAWHDGRKGAGRLGRYCKGHLHHLRGHDAFDARRG
ncbi:hypothetical protein CEJ88_15450, partial [Staphylococcus aureus]